MFHDRKLLRKQLELLAEQSRGATESELADLSVAMCKICSELDRPLLLAGVPFLLAMCLYLVIGFLVHIK